MALTASAPPDIQATIVLNNSVYVNGDLDRPNIYIHTGIHMMACEVRKNGS